MGFLDGIQYPNRKKLLDEIYDNFINVSPSELKEVNINSYLDKPLESLPELCSVTDAKISHKIQLSKPIWCWVMWACGIKFDPKKHRQANSLAQFQSGR